MGNSHTSHSNAAEREPFPTTIGGDVRPIFSPRPQVVNASIQKESLSSSRVIGQHERRNSVPLLGIRGVLSRSSPSQASKIDAPTRSATPPPVMPSASASPPATPLEQQHSSSSVASSSSSSMPPRPPVLESPSSSSTDSSRSVRRMPRSIGQLAKKASSRGLCSLKRRISRQKTLKVVPVPCDICPPGMECIAPCTFSPIQEVCSDAFSHILNFLTIPEMCATSRVSQKLANEVDATLAHLHEGSFLAQDSSTKLHLFEENQNILKTLSRRCPRLRRLTAQTYVRLSREQCQVLMRGCPRIQQISPSIEFQAADIVSVGMKFPDFTEGRVHFSTVEEGEEFSAVCPKARSLLIDSDNDYIGEIAAVLGQRLPDFKFLSIDLCSRSVARACIDKIPAHLTLAMSIVGNITKQNCVHLTKCRSNLVTLHLHHIPAEGFPVDGLFYMSRHLPTLKELDLPHTTVSMIRPADNEISQVLSDSKSFPNLKRLYLKRYSSTFQAILSKSKNHVHLGRRSCS